MKSIPSPTDCSLGSAAGAAPREDKPAAPEDYEILVSAVNIFSHNELKDFVRKMLISSPEAREFTKQNLIVTSGQVSANTTAPMVETGSGRLNAQSEAIPRYATCKNCNKNYDITNNGNKACSFHPGKLVVVSLTPAMLINIGWKEVDDADDFWADHDPDCHGDPEDFVDDEDFAGGFQWSCCNKPGDAKECVTQTHEPVEGESQNSAKRKRLQ